MSKTKLIAGTNLGRGYFQVDLTTNQIINISKGYYGRNTIKCLMKWDKKFDLEAANNLINRSYIGHTGSINYLLKLNSAEFASGSNDCTIKIWNYQSYVCSRTLKGHTDLIKTIIKLKENLIASGGFDGMIRLWEFHKGNCVKVFSPNFGPIFCLLKINNLQILCACKKNLNIIDISI